MLMIVLFAAAVIWCLTLFEGIEGQNKNEVRLTMDAAAAVIEGTFASPLRFIMTPTVSP